MAQLSIYDKQRHHSKKDFTCSIGAHNYIYITFRHDSWKRFTSSEHIKVIRTESGAFKFIDPTAAGPGMVFKLKTDKKGDPKTREHTRYLQIDGVKYPGFFEIAQRTAGSYDFPKEEAKLEKNEATEYLKKIYAESNQKAEPYPPLNLGELLQIAINNAVATAFEAYLPGTFKEVLQKQFEEEYRRGRIKGFEEGKAYAEKPTPACTENPDKWAI